jgi:zinc protease
MGHLTVPITHPDYRELEVLSVILGAGSGLTGRIPSRIREREGLAYSSWAAAVAAAGLDPGRLTVAVGTSPSTIGRAEQAVVEELERLVAEGVEESEVDDARSYLLGREAFRRETARQCAELEAQATFYGIPLDRSEWLAEKLEGLDAERINALARLHVRPNELLTTVAIPGSQT